mmetsp:Transcript_54473/g.129841  ORF Transcript_54473/g.129841 Transcript_54473/m.129841 type:complete len:365 (+) Transcript_54473:82-1176(+)
MSFALLLPLLVAAVRAEIDANSSFPCGFGAGRDNLPPFVEISDAEAEARQCCTKLPCKYKTGCWAEQMPPLYSAPRAQALTREQANYMENELLWPMTKVFEKTSAPSMPNNFWYRIPVPQDTHAYFYEGIKRAFKETFDAALRMPVTLDIFFVTDFAPDLWADDETYKSSYAGAGYWIHNDCSNFRICFEETGYKADEFTGNGVAFVLPVALPSKVDFRDGHTMMPAALELYNISHGQRDEEGSLLKPPNRQWMDAYRYNLGEIIFFNAFRWHSGHVPRVSEFIAEDNPLRTRAETVGFAAELKNGDWVLFRMCKGSTDDAVTKKILKTDVNPSSTGESTHVYDANAEERSLHETEACDAAASA